MGTKLMSGLWRYMLSIPPFLWEKQLLKESAKKRAELAFMTEEHRLVHHYIVRELPRVGEPISPEFVAEKLSMPHDRVQSIFDDLEEHMTFICRNDEGSAVWAYPVTVEKTPHHLTFSTGEKIYAA
ncbi:MAG: hypothetical protein C4532_11540 [Candidatus Abyssobacteria bacterium SURF_17]|uniref:Uncharacterized protein n=1 Tax=Candidatus Abyssobacteria bacterium SURF_17 TaxID=2093361 RepID=A0A419EX98_9BACT|nr:MAG: hypothetical protein C4532_11540 [Candidatus Abyssubacteria bacterium SURF_17]